MNRKDFCFLLRFFFFAHLNTFLSFYVFWLKTITSSKRLIRLVPCPINTFQEYGFVRNHLLYRKKVTHRIIFGISPIFSCNVFVLIFKTLHKIMSHCLLAFQDVKNLHQVVKLPVKMEIILIFIYLYNVYDIVWLPLKYCFLFSLYNFLSIS